MNQFLTRQLIKQVLIGLILIAIFSIGLNLRIQMVQQTIVDHPIRADAADYYLYAYNLTQYGVYSSQRPGQFEAEKPTPDAQRNPGYALFLLPFVEFPPTPEMVHHIVITQAIISTLTILVAFGLFIAFLSWPWALGATFLVAISPHLVAVNIYVLTETLFTFFLVLLAWAMTQFTQRKNALFAFMIGIILGLALLVRPTLLYFLIFLIPALFVFFPKKPKKIVLVLSVFLVIGFAVSYGPWVMRNVLVNPTQSSLAIATIHKGMYPNLMYNDDPKTYGLPNRFDPEWDEREDLSSVIKEILGRVKEDPLKYLHWYSIGKPTLFFSWNIVVGMGDIFIYPVHTSPYFQAGWFALTHHLMTALHWPLVVLALLTTLMVWLPIAKKRLSDNALIVARFASLIMIYFMLVHIVGTPLPRYSIPLRPFIYGLAMLGLHMMITNAYRVLIKAKPSK
jgi:4-amino-4-deoxy-L-arabinose transferase-like glycosyltransferase